MLSKVCTVWVYWQRVQPSRRRESAILAYRHKTIAILLCLAIFCQSDLVTSLSATLTSRPLSFQNSAPIWEVSLYIHRLWTVVRIWTGNLSGKPYRECLDCPLKISTLCGLWLTGGTLKKPYLIQVCETWFTGSQVNSISILLADPDSEVSGDFTISLQWLQL